MPRPIFPKLRCVGMKWWDEHTGRVVAQIIGDTWRGLAVPFIRAKENALMADHDVEHAEEGLAGWRYASARGTGLIHAPRGTAKCNPFLWLFEQSNLRRGDAPRNTSRFPATACSSACDGCRGGQG